MRWALILLLLCSSAQAADPWTPFRKAFPGPREPVEVEPLPPVLSPELPSPPPPIMVPEPEPLPAPPIVVVVPPPTPPRDAKSPDVRPKTRKPLNLTPKPCEGPPLTRSCQEVCDYATRYTFRELQALRALGIATGQIENRPISCQEDRDGKECIRKYCRDTAKR